MNTSISLENGSEPRGESRLKECFPRLGAVIRPVDDPNAANGAIALDISGSGIGLIAARPYPVGAIIQIDLGDDYSAIGEVVGLREDFDEWDWHGMSCMNVHLIEKRAWPL